MSGIKGGYRYAPISINLTHRTSCLRRSSYGARPTAEMYINFADGVIGYIDDSGQPVDLDLSEYLPLTGGTLTGPLTMAQASLIIDGAIDTVRSIHGQTAGVNRWEIRLPGLIPETGAHGGADFGIFRYDDAGTFLDNPLGIVRLTGTTWLTGGSGQAALHATRMGPNGNVIGFAQGATTCGSISVADATTTTYNTTSDDRLKEDAQAFDAASIIDATNVYNFAWKESGIRAYGVIAQEAQEVFPDAVFHDEEKDWWGVDYSKYVPLLLNEIKALRARVAALEGAPITALASGPDITVNTVKVQPRARPKR